MTAQKHDSTLNLSTVKDNLTYIIFKYVIPKDKLQFRQSYYLRRYYSNHSRPAIQKFSTCLFEVVDCLYTSTCSIQMQQVINSNPIMISLGNNLIFCIYSQVCMQCKLFLLLTNFWQILIRIRHAFGQHLILLVFMSHGINISIASAVFNNWTKTKGKAVTVLN